MVQQGRFPASEVASTLAGSAGTSVLGQAAKKDANDNAACEVKMQTWTGARREEHEMLEHMH